MSYCVVSCACIAEFNLLGKTSPHSDLLVNWRESMTCTTLTVFQISRLQDLYSSGQHICQPLWVTANIRPPGSATLAENQDILSHGNDGQSCLLSREFAAANGSNEALESRQVLENSNRQASSAQLPLKRRLARQPLPPRPSSPPRATVAATQASQVPTMRTHGPGRGCSNWDSVDPPKKIERSTLVGPSFFCYSFSPHLHPKHVNMQIPPRVLKASNL
jgi:hypothetical protein